MIKSTITYIDEILSTHPEIKNEAALSRELTISRQAISQYRTGHNMSVYVAVRVARMLNINPMETISATMYEQAKTPVEREFWKAEHDDATAKRKHHKRRRQDQAEG
jgi:predicted transcriptional regulator